MVAGVVLALVLAGGSLMWRHGVPRLVVAVGYAVLAGLFALQARRLRKDMDTK